MKDTKMFRKIVFFSFAVFLFFVMQPTFAISYGGIGGRPAFPDPNVENSDTWFIYNLDAGTEKEDAVIIQNPTESDLEIAVYPADSTPSTDGGFALKQKVDEMNSIGSWITFYPNTPPEFNEAIVSAFYDDVEPDGIRERCYVIERAGDADLIEFYEIEFGASVSENGAQFLSELSDYCTGKSELELSVPSGKETQVPFIISIPEDVEVGEHAGAIMVQKIERDDSVEGSGTGIKLTTRIGVRVYETVPGDIVRGLEFVSFSNMFDSKKNAQIFSVSLKNDGNVSQDAVIRFVVDSLYGSTPGEQIERKIKVARGDNFTSNFEWTRPDYGKYEVYALVTYQDDTGDHVIDSRDYYDAVTILIIPWVPILGVLAVLLFFVIVLVLWRRSYKKLTSSKGWKPYVVKQSDTLRSLSKKYNVEWKRIVAVNRLMKPYGLEKGDRILLPARKAAASRKKVVKKKQV